MKLPEIKIEVDGSDNFTEESFSVGNAGLIFDILRNKLYSDAVQSICREYSCNARDAHREIGTPEKPIEIHLPNQFDGNFIIKDYGTGISKNRMSDVFIKYGNSTKRDDNVQLGAYGCGAKSAYSYTNIFSIITVVKENNLNIKYNYIAYLDDTNAGKMRLVSEDITIEPTGTSIVIPVQDKDIQSFIDGTIKSTQYWPVKPLFFGATVEYPVTVGAIIAESKDWKIYDKKNKNDYSSSKAECLAIIDGVQYKINDSFVNVNDRWILSCNVHLFFDIGLLTLSASRESLQYDENTKKIINERIKSVQKELSDQLIEILDKKETYVEAVEFFNFMNSYFYKALNKQNLSWRGKKIIGSEIALAMHALNNMKAEIKSFSKHRQYGKTGVRLTRPSRIIIDSSSEVYFNDLKPEHTYRNKNLKALESHSLIQIINYIKDKSYTDFVTDYKQAIIDYNKSMVNFHYQEPDNSFIFDIIEPKLLSSIVEDKLPPRSKVPKPKPVDKISGYRLYDYNNWKLRDNFKSEIIDPNQSGCYVETFFKKDSCTSKYNDQIWSFDHSDMSHILKLLKNVDIFSVKEKDLIKLPKLKPLSEVIEEKFNKLVTTDYYKSMAMNKVLKTYGETHYNSFANLNELTGLLSSKHKIKDKNSPIIQYFDYIKHFENNVSLQFINKIESLLNKKNDLTLYIKDANILLDEIKNRYKLLTCINYNSKPQDVIDYINLCDQEFNKNKSIKMAIGA